MGAGPLGLPERCLGFWGEVPEGPCLPKAQEGLPQVLRVLHLSRLRLVFRASGNAGQAAWDRYPSCQNAHC